MDHVRIWAIVNGSPVKLTLHRGDEVSHYVAYATDEGWSSQRTTWSFDGAIIYRLDEDDGVDCDGRLSHVTDCRCRVEDRAALRFPEAFNVPLPKWEREWSGQRDYAAEAMGY